MKCKICQQDVKKIFKSKILNKYEADYFYCSYCGFLQTEEPYWLEEAYSNSITITDTGYIHRNLYLSRLVSWILYLFFDKNGKYLDYGGGYGVFVRLMRDIGFDFYWYDKFSPNLFSKGFEYRSNEKYNAITSFETFEHFVTPLEEIEKMVSISSNIIFTTELLPNPIPEPDKWWYYCFEDGQHISFFSKKTFVYIANKFKLKYINFKNLHILTEKELSTYHLRIAYILTKLPISEKYLMNRLKSKTWEDFLYTRKLIEGSHDY